MVLPYDINPRTGGKITGVLTPWQRILSLLVAASIIARDQRAAYPEEWFHLDHCAHGPDLSKWQGTIDWNTLRLMSDLVIVRAGYGTSYDSQWTANRPFLKTSEKQIRGVYWYYNTGATVEQQTNIILEALSYFQPGELETFDLDIEKSYNNYTSTTFKTAPLQILRNIRNARPDLRIRQYWNLDVWNNYLSAVAGYKEFPAWLAWYPYAPLTTKYPALPNGIPMDLIDLWQYWADGNNQGALYGAQSSAIDLNRSRLPLADYRALFHKPIDPPEPTGCSQAVIDALHAAWDTIKKKGDEEIEAYIQQLPG